MGPWHNKVIFFVTFTLWKQCLIFPVPLPRTVTLTAIFHPKETSFFLWALARDISAHLRQISVSQTSVSSEKELILARVGLFDEGGRDFTICPKHRDQLGVKFKASIKCQHPLHGNRKGKRERGVNLRMSKEIKTKWNVVVPVGAGKLLCLFIFESS